ncbi:MAG TPA: cellulase family glycosylhydrolase [Candidatus Saccharimonadales bacterium]
MAIAVLAMSLVIQANVPKVQAEGEREVGFSTSATLLRMKSDPLNKRLANIAEMGATWIRVDFKWGVIQPNNSDSYDWEMFDRVVAAAGEHNLKVIGLLAYTPKWAQDPLCAKLVVTEAAGTRCSPKNNESFANFARTAAQRYKGKSIRAWEIWNEPNLSAYWKTVQADGRAVHADPIAYAKLANAGAKAIRETGTDAKIITGGLAPFWEPVYPKGFRQSDYLAQLLPRLDPSLFDAVGIHPYSWPLLPDKKVMYNAFFSVDQGREKYNLRTIMYKNGFGDKQIWGTEYGAPTYGVSQPGKRTDHVTENQQAQIIERGIENWFQKTNVGPLIIHSDSDRWLPSRKNEKSFGLLRADGSEKPAYDALQSAIEDL